MPWINWVWLRTCNQRGIERNSRLHNGWHFEYLSLWGGKSSLSPGQRATFRAARRTQFCAPKPGHKFGHFVAFLEIIESIFAQVSPRFLVQLPIALINYRALGWLTQIVQYTVPHPQRWLHLGNYRHRWRVVLWNSYGATKSGSQLVEYFFL